MCHCKVCNATDPALFYPSIKTYCREHWKARVKENRTANIEHYREFDRQRANLPHRVVAREQYRNTEAFAESHAKAARKWDAVHPDRKSASLAVNNALRDGKLIRHPCLICGCRAEAHHPDYSDPLYPVWLCTTHHKQAHVLTRAILRAERVPTCKSHSTLKPALVTIQS